MVAGGYTALLLLLKAVLLVWLQRCHVCGVRAAARGHAAVGALPPDGLDQVAGVAHIWGFHDCSDFTCAGCARQLEGTLPAVLANLTALTTLELGGNSFKGSLPASWGANGSFPVSSRSLCFHFGCIEKQFAVLEVLQLRSDSSNGSLPA